MKISMLPSVLCALVVGAICLTVRAEDNPAQAAARIAIANQLFELGAQSTNPASADTNVVTQPANDQEARAQAKAQAKADKAAAKAKAKQEAAEAKAAAEQAKAQAAADKAAAEAAQAEAEKKAKADKAAAEAKAKQDAAQQAAADAAQKTDAEKKDEAEKAALITAQTSQYTGQSSTNWAATPTPAPSPGPASGTDYAGKDLGMPPVAAPALPISADKQARLQALLLKYKADQLTPEEYHQQRAAILAEP